MFRLLKKFIRTLLGSFIRLLCFLISFVIIFSLLWRFIDKKNIPPMPKQNGVLYLKLKGNLVDNENFSLDREKEIVFGKVYQVLNKAAEDEKISGLCIKFDDFHGGLSNILDLLECLKKFKSNGKFITCYADNYTPCTYLLSSIANEIILPRQGSFYFPGFCICQSYLKDFFDKIGIKYDVVKVGEYKSAPEPYTSNKMSPENRQQLRELLEGINSFYTQTLAENRGIPFDVVAENLKTIRFQPVGDLKSNKFISCVDFFNAKEYVQSLSSDETKYSLVKLGNYWKHTFANALENEDKIVVVTLEGVIGRKEKLNYKKVHRIFKSIKKDKAVKGVVVKINSPGGEVFETDLIHHEISKFSKEMPLVVYFSDYAASGGYYISVAADTIVSSPCCLTGSIGIYGSFFNAKKLSDKLGVVYETEKIQPYADLGVPMKDMTNEEKQLVYDGIKRGYENFLGLVAEGRNKTRDEVDKVARGRVWLGSVAKDIGLVDEVGTMALALDKVAQKAGINKYEVCFTVKEFSPYFFFGKESFTFVALNKVFTELIFGRNVFADEIAKGVSVLENRERDMQVYAYCPLKMEF